MNIISKIKRGKTMGKKSKASSSRASAPTPNSTPMDTSTMPPSSNAAAAAAASAPVYYPSDGPSDVELLQTTSATLQVKLNRLTQLGLANDRPNFVKEFVPLDLSEADAGAYLQDLTTHPEADGQWNNLVAEIAAMRAGAGVDKIEGDQVNKATFYFVHPLLQNCDREVVFNCVNGEWRAHG
jgi:hypothetical protein